MSPAHNGLRSVVSSHFSTLPSAHERVLRGPIIRRFISSYESFLCPDIVIRGEFAGEEKMNAVFPPLSSNFASQRGINFPRSFITIIRYGEFFPIASETCNRSTWCQAQVSSGVLDDRRSRTRKVRPSKIDFSSGMHARTGRE